jgi:hypothetical protein
MESSPPSPPVKKTVGDYLQSMNEKEKKGYEIAKSHLGLYFNLETSNGFIKYLSL